MVSKNKIDIFHHIWCFTNPSQWICKLQMDQDVEKFSSTPHVTMTVRIDVGCNPHIKPGLSKLFLRHRPLSHRKIYTSIVNI